MKVVAASLDCAKAPKKYEKWGEWAVLLQNYMHSVELFWWHVWRCAEDVRGCLLELLIVTCLRKFTKSDYWLRHNLLSVCPSVRTSVRMELGWKWTGFHFILYLRLFRKYVKKIKVWLKADKNNGDLTWRPEYSYCNTLHDDLSTVTVTPYMTTWVQLL